MKILIVFGTRPEAIKMLPVVKALGKMPNVDSRVCVTAQHREMLDQVLNIYGFTPAYDLNIMVGQQTLTSITCSVLAHLEPVLADFQPDWVLVHGDTTTTFAAALAAYYKKTRVGHLEAGLRTGDIYSPWPEEVNRKLTACVTSVHFAPTIHARDNLLKEGVKQENIVVTGNTVIDALYEAVEYIKERPQVTQKFQKQFEFISHSKKIILVTCHRRENFGDGIKNVCYALLELAKRNDVQIIYPVHLNPNIRKPVFELLSQQENIFLIEPLDYLAFIYLMSRCYLILTDSGGIQEEAPSLGKPVVVARENTERPEAVTSGAVVLAGVKKQAIIAKLVELLDDPKIYHQMSIAGNPYGDGKAVDRVIEKLISLHFDHDVT